MTIKPRSGTKLHAKLRIKLIAELFQSLLRS